MDSTGRGQRESGGWSGKAMAALARVELASRLSRERAEGGGGCGRDTDPVQRVGVVMGGAPPVFEVRTLRLSLNRTLFQSWPIMVMALALHFATTRIRAISLECAYY